MRTSALAVFLCGALACGGHTAPTTQAGSGPLPEGSSWVDASTSASSDALVGSWTLSGGRAAVGITDVTLTFAADKTFTMVESVRPMSEPAGTPPTSCVTTETYVGTYAAGANTLDLRFTGGTANAIVGCSAASAGTPMNQDEIAARKQEHEILAPMNAYSVSATTLVLTPTPSDPRILGLDVNATTYTRLD